jgi:hypothetical protein
LRDVRPRESHGGKNSRSLADQLAQLLELALHAAADLLAEPEDALVNYPVVGEVPLLAPSHDARLQQNTEVFGDVLLRSAGGLDEVADAGLALAQPVDERDPHWLREHAEARGYQVAELARERVWQAHEEHHSISIGRCSCRRRSGGAADAGCVRVCIR